MESKKPNLKNAMIKNKKKPFNTEMIDEENLDAVNKYRKIDEKMA